MPLTNSHDTYGTITKSFHWMTALLILTAIPLGIIGNNIAEAIKDPAIATTEADLSRAAFLFSLHKTIGVTVFFVALARILWAISQPKPGLLNGDKSLEAWAAETAHWLLYGSLVAVPMTGWIHHAATTGFAPIWWPFGQSLPFVPKDADLAHTFASLHYVLNWVLILSLGAHIAGALKHHVIDKDSTLRRMLPGSTSATPTSHQPGHGKALLTAIVIWAAALGVGGAFGLYGHETTAQAATEVSEPVEQSTAAATPSGEPAENEWAVKQGTLGLTVKQLGSDITGEFADWSAKIIFDETADANGKHGSVEVTVTISSLTLGSVTDQAKGADYLDANGHPTATFSADIVASEDAYVADGSLMIKGQSVPATLPFDLAIDGNTANASGGLTVDRRNFGVGAETEDNVAASVQIQFDLTAER